MTPELRAKLEASNVLYEAGELDDAWDIVNAILMDNPNEPAALMSGACIQEKARRLTVAYSLAERGARISPSTPAMWLNLGRISEELFRLDEAMSCYEQALSLTKKPEHQAKVLENIGALHVVAGRWEKAEEISRKALAINPAMNKAKSNLGIACLAQRKWRDGWDGYSAIVGSAHRKLIQYAGEPQWDGTVGRTVAIYGEQGLGDEVSFASMLPDAIRDCSKVVIDCDKRLEGLFKRSFPQASVYGTRTERALDWALEDRCLDASLTMGGLGKLYRQKDADFPGTPYLKADPERTEMWKALFASKRKPVIGIAWTGGVQWTASKFRKWDLPGLLPLLASVDAHWVSLQYKDATKELKTFHAEQDAVQIHQYPYGTLTKDYDDTAAMVASLDLVICMQTAVAHLAGALGKECWVFVPNFSQWRYGSEGDSIPWYKSVKVFRQDKNGSWPLGLAKRLLTLRYGDRNIQRAKAAA